VRVSDALDVCGTLLIFLSLVLPIAGMLVMATSPKADDTPSDQYVGGLITVAAGALTLVLGLLLRGVAFALGRYAKWRAAGAEANGPTAPARQP
jgi:uncharacterized membrane protein